MSLYDIIIGGVAGIVSRSTTAPLDLYKIQRQNFFIPNATIRDTIRKEGFRYLWKGNLTNCIKIFPYTGINYAVYSSTNKYITDNYSDKSIFLERHNLIHLISGGVGGVVSTLCVYPLETVRTRLSLQLCRNKYKGIFDALYKIPKRELYGGLSVSICGFTIFNALNFFWFNKLKAHFPSEPMNPLSKIFYGGTAGLLSIVVTYPSDLLRRRMQLRNYDSVVPKYNGVVDCIRKIYNSDGIFGFYKGFIPASIRIFPTIGIQFLCFETLKKNN